MNIEKKVREKAKKYKEQKTVEETEKQIEKLEKGELTENFLIEVEKYGKNEKNEKITLYPWMREYAKLISDLRIKQVNITGSAQIGKTLINALLMVWLVLECRLNVLFNFAGMQALNRMIDILFHPLFENWLESKNETFPETKNKQLLVKNGIGIFSYSPTTQQEKQGRATASINQISFSCDVVFCDERSQYISGAIDPIMRRLDASRINTKPIRFLGTPGNGGGIETEIEKSEYKFESYVKCQNCGKDAPLHPFGALLKSKKIKNYKGEIEKKFLSDSGKPLDWHYKNKEMPVETAYIGCCHCKNELTNIADNAFFKCSKTGIYLSDFFQQNVLGCNASIIISPLLRKSKINLAKEIITDGIKTSNASDWCQQRLGLPSEIKSKNLTINQIKHAIKAPKPNPTRNQFKTIAGIDQGRSNDYLVLIDYILPLKWQSMNVQQIISQTKRLLKYGGAYNRNEIIKILNHNDCDFGLIDNEPNISAAWEIARKTKIELVDQKPKQKDSFKKSHVLDGGDQFDCWYVNNNKLLSMPYETFNTYADDDYPLIRLPDSWLDWLNNPSEVSPIKHLTSISFDGENWTRHPDGVDDIYFAFAFCEMAFFISISQNSYPYWFNYL